MTDALKGFYKAFRGGDVNAVHAIIEAGTDLAGATFKGAATGGFDLHESDFGNTEFEDCVLSHINWSSASLAGAYLHGTTLVECDLRGANLEGLSMDGCVLKDCDLTGANLDATELTGVDFDGCTLSDVSLNEAAWESITIAGGLIAGLKGEGEWTGVIVRDAEFGSLDFGDMTLTRCTTNTDKVPEGFQALSGRRTRIG